MTKILALLSFVFLPISAYAQSTAQPVIPGILTTVGCPSGSTVCFQQNSVSNPFFGAIIGSSGATSGYVYTSNGPGVAATFQPSSGGGTVTLGTSQSATNPQRSGDATTGFFSDTAATIEAAISGTKVLTWNAAGESLVGALTVTSSSANALTIGTSGVTNPVLSVNDSTTSSTTGITIIGAATGGNTSINATDSSANAGINLSAKGGGGIALSTITGNISTNGGTFVVTHGGFGTWQFGTSQSSWAMGASATPTSARFLLTPNTDTGIAASTNSPLFQMAGTGVVRQHATGTLDLQSDNIFSGTTDGFVAASTLTNANVLELDMKSCGTNGTCTNENGLYIPTQTLTGSISTSYALNINAATGAGNNYAASFMGGNVGVGTLFPGAALDVETSNSTALAVNQNIRAATAITSRGAVVLDSGFTGQTALDIFGRSGTVPVFQVGVSNATQGGAMTIGSTGLVSIGTSVPVIGGPLTISGLSTGMNADFLCLSSTGVVLLQSSSCTISKRQFKENIIDLDDSSLDEVMEFKPVQFNMKSQKNADGKEIQNADKNFSHTQIGFIAEDVAEIDPRVTVYEQDEKTPKSWDERKFVALLTKAVQVEQREIESLDPTKVVHKNWFGRLMDYLEGAQ